MTKTATLAAVLGAALAFAAAAAQAKPRPVNKLCPIMANRKVDPQNTVIYKGKPVGLCCSECVEKWNKNPGAFIGNVKEDADEGPDGLSSLKEALTSARQGPYPIVIFWHDGGAKGKAFLKLLSDPEISEALTMCSFVRADAKRDAADLKGFKPGSLPGLGLYDPTTDPPSLLKNVPGGAAKAVLKELQDAIKKVRKE
jgi:hypothetical protein